MNRNRWFKTAAALAAALVVTGVVTACGSAGSSGGSSNGQGTSQGIDKSTKTITLGASGPKSGPDVIYYNEIQGAAAYFDMVNAAGGINGWKIKYVTLDDQYQPAKAVVNIKQLVTQDKVFALANDVGTTAIRAVLPFVKQAGIPLVAPASGRDIFQSFGFASNMFPVGPSFRDEGALLTDYAVKHLGAKKLAFFYSQDAIGDPALPGYQSAVKSTGADNVATLSYPVSETDFSSYAQRLKASGAQAVVTFAGVPGTVGVQKAAAAIGYHPKWLAAWFVANASFTSTGGADGTYFDAWMTPLVFKTGPVSQYLTMLKKYEPKASPGPVSQQGWVDAVVTVEGLRALINSGKPMTWGNLVAALETLHGYNAGLANGITYTHTSHLGVTTEDIIQAQKSKFAVVEKNATLGR